MKKNYVVIGLGRFGLSLLDELSKHTDNLIGIDSEEEAVQNAAKIIHQVYIADSTSEKAMKELSVQNADHVVISFGSNFEATIMTFVTLKNLGVKNITVRCDHEHYIPILTKLGVDDIISPTKLAGTRLASRIISPDFVDYFQLANDYAVVEVPVPERFREKPIIQMNTRNRFSVNILLIKRNKTSIAPTATDVIRAGDELFVFGPRRKIIAFTEFLKDND